jgi:hypothetical protein
VFSQTVTKGSYADVTISSLPRAAKNIDVSAYLWAISIVSWTYNWTTYAGQYIYDNWYSSPSIVTTTTTWALCSIAFDRWNTVYESYSMSITVQSITSSTVVLRISYTWESSAPATISANWYYNILL